MNERTSPPTEKNSNASSFHNGTVAVPIPTREEKPQVEVFKDGEVVQSIRVSCPCGCSIDLQCQYSD